MVDPFVALSEAMLARQRYNALTEIVIQAAREYRDSGRPELLEALGQLDAQRREEFDEMNTGLRAAHVGEFPWTPWDQFLTMIEPGE